MPYPQGSPELVKRAQACNDSTALAELKATLVQLKHRRSYMRKFRPTAEELAFFDEEWKRISVLAASRANAQHTVAADELDERLEQIELLAAQSRACGRRLADAMDVAHGMLPRAKRQRARGSNEPGSAAGEESMGEQEPPREPEASGAVEEPARELEAPAAAMELQAPGGAERPDIAAEPAQELKAPGGAPATPPEPPLERPDAAEAPAQAPGGAEEPAQAPGGAEEGHEHEPLTAGVLGVDAFPCVLSGLMAFSALGVQG